MILNVSRNVFKRPLRREGSCIAQPANFGLIVIWIQEPKKTITTGKNYSPAGRTNTIPRSSLIGARTAGLSNRSLAIPNAGANWLADAYAGIWFFTTNHDFWSHNSFCAGTRSQSQNPIGAFEADDARSECSRVPNYRRNHWTTFDHCGHRDLALSGPAYSAAYD
jgi:hypothetical protein